MLARLEAGAGQMRLDTISDALVGTGFMLCVTFSQSEPDPSPDGGASGCAATSDDEPELQVAPRRTNPPPWWWMHEFFNDDTRDDVATPHSDEHDAA